MFLTQIFLFFPVAWLNVPWEKLQDMCRSRVPRHIVGFDDGSGPTYAAVVMPSWEFDGIFTFENEHGN